MALSVTHATAADGTFSASGTTAWDEAHTLTGVASAAQGGTGVAYFSVAGPTATRIYTFPDQAATILYSGGALGTPASGTLTNATGLPEAGLTLADNTTNNFSTTKHGFVPKGTNVGSFLKDDGTWAAPTASATLDGISAATADQSGISNGDNFVRWNWAKTTNSENAFMFGESSAATNGTSSSGVPNQVLLRLATVAASTMSPLRVDSRGTHVFSVSPSAPQLLGNDGSTANPTYGFASSVNSGVAYSSGVNLIASGALSINATNTQLLVRAGAATTPGITDHNLSGSTGTAWLLHNTMSIVNTTDGEWVRFLSRVQQNSRGSADATAYALNFRKSRGTVASPTVITTGDDLATISGYGYVGATGTYVEAATIRFDSTGTIADTTTGVGGIIRFETRAVGGAVTEAMRIQGGTVPQMLSADGVLASPAFSFASQAGTGLWRGATGGGSQLVLNSIGTDLAAFSTTGNVISRGGGAEGIAGNGVAPALSALCVVTNGSTDANSNINAFYSGANAVGARIYGYKSRGTDTAPTVITTGDDLLKIAGFGYVGATGVFVEAATLTADSDGTIADSTTGVGGIWRLSTRKVAGSVTERMTVDNNETAAETSILVSINGGAPVRVSKGANDSGGAGFAVLRIPN